jgi:hypothetical protein
VQRDTLESASTRLGAIGAKQELLLGALFIVHNAASPKTIRLGARREGTDDDVRCEADLLELGQRVNMESDSVSVVGQSVPGRPMLGLRQGRKTKIHVKRIERHRFQPNH